MTAGEHKRDKQLGSSTGVRLVRPRFDYVYAWNNAREIKLGRADIVRVVRGSIIVHGYPDEEFRSDLAHFREYWHDDIENLAWFIGLGSNKNDG